MTKYLPSVLPLLLMTSLVIAQAPPQRMRSEYGLDDPSAPKELSSIKAPPPVGGVTAYAPAPNVLWIGATEGLMRLTESQNPWERTQYFASVRYLPDDLVVALHPDDGGGIWVRTKTGVSHIEFQPMSLQDKALFFEQRLAERHSRNGIVSESQLSSPGDLTTSKQIPTRGDAYWTALYAAAQAFRAAAIGSPDAARAAGQSLDALERMEKATGVPGLPARTWVAKGQNKPEIGPWRPAADGQGEWLGGAGPEEVLGTVFAWRAAFDHLEDSARKEQATEAIRRLATHLLENGWKLADPNGSTQPPARWDVDYLISSQGRPESPLRAVELMAILRTAAHVTGDEKFLKEYQRLSWRLGMSDMATRYLEFRAKDPPNYTWRLRAKLAYYLLFLDEDDLRLKARLREAWNQWYRGMAQEASPLAIIVETLANPEAGVSFDAGKETLARSPIDLVTWTIRNSHRRDVVMDNQKDYLGRPQSRTLLPPDERPVMKLNGNPFLVDGGDKGLHEDDGLTYLLPYWMARHHNLLND